MLRNLLKALPIIALTACAESGTSMTTPDGKKVNLAKCTRDSSACIEKAASICGGPYQVIDSYSKSGGLVADIMPGPVTWYYLSYRCGTSDGKLPQFPFRGQEYRPAPVVMAPAQSYRQPVNCTSSRLGNTVNTTCY